MECSKEKTLFYKNIIRLTLFSLMVLLVYMERKNTNDKKEEIINAFNSNQEIICDKKIVSKDRSYIFYKDDTKYITNGENMFLLRLCRVKD